MKTRFAWFAAFLGLLATTALGAAVNYTLAKKVGVSGTGGWDYVSVDEGGWPIG